MDPDQFLREFIQPIVCISSMIIWGVVFFLISLLIYFVQQRKFRDHDGLPRNPQAVFTLPPD